MNSSASFHKPFYGRERELSELVENLMNPSCFVLTMTGIGGIGKTSLALKLSSEIESSFQDGVCFVSLAGLEHSGQVAPAILSRLGIVISGSDISEQLFDVLSGKNTLLILDNFEHLLGAACLVEQILSRTQKVKILITSRTRLRVGGEFVYELTGMDVPDDNSAQSLSSASAVLLFISSSGIGHTLAVDDLKSVSGICRAVEGVPLCIELASAWLGRKTLLEILDEIVGEKGLLFEENTLLEARHSSLRKVFDYSWLLLSREEKSAFSELSVFRGGFDKEAAKFVTGISEALLASLRDKSLIRVEFPERYSMHPLLHDFSSVKLQERPERRESLGLKHAEYYCKLLGKNERDLDGKNSFPAMEDITRNLPDVRAAIRFTFRQSKSNTFLHASRAAMQYFFRSGLLEEGLEIFRDAAIMFKDTRFQESLEMKVNQARFALEMARYDEAASLLEPVLADGNQLLLARAEFLLGVVFLRTGNLTRAGDRMRKSLMLARSEGSSEHEAAALGGLGDLYNHMHEADRTEIFMMQALEINSTAGNIRGLFSNLITLSNLMFYSKRKKEAYQYANEAFECAGILNGSLNIALAHVSLAAALELNEEFDQALENANKAVHLFEGINSRWGMQTAFQIKASIESSLGLVEDSLLSANRIVQLSEEIGGTYNSMESLITAGEVFEKAGNPDEALEVYTRAHKIACNLNTGTYLEKLNTRISSIKK